MRTKPGIILALTLAVSGIALAAAMNHHPARPAIPTYGLQANTTDAPSVPVDGNIRAAVEHALRTHQGKVVPPNAAAGADPTADDFHKMKNDGTADINSIFGPVAAASESKDLDRAIVMEKTDNFRVLAGGYEKLKFTAVDISGSSATVSVTVDAWSQFKFKNPDGKWIMSRPENTLNVTMTLSQDSGTQHWTIQTFDWDFAPGSGP